MGANDQQRHNPFYPHTNPEVSACYQSFPVEKCAIIGPPIYKELIKTVIHNLEGHMLRKNPKGENDQQRCTPFFQHTNA
jgi:hypothetical protein